MKNYRLYILLILFSYVCFSEGSIKSFKKENKTFYNKAGSSKIHLINSNVNHTRLKIELEGYEFKEILNDEYLIKIDKGTSILNKGAPNLPKLNTSIIIPDQKNMKIKIVDTDYVEFENVNIIPSKGNLSRDVNPLLVPYTYGEVYETDAFYPESIAELGEPYILRGLRGQGVVINPIQYNPVKKVLRVYSTIELSIKESNNFRKVKKNTIQRKKHFIKENNEFRNIYNNLFINFSSDTRFEYLLDQGKMLIICYDSFIQEMEPFVLWKNKKGIPTEIVAVSNVGNSVSQIQEYVNSYYYDNGLTYLLLVGDAAQVPTHIVGGSASDPTYGYIEGTDAFSEIIVGRFSANNPSQVATQVQRTLQYEQDPSVNVDHFNKALGIASTQGPGYGGLTDDQFNELIWSDFLNEFTYSSYEGIYDSNGSLSQGINAINNGVGVINYTGHSGPTGWGNGAPLSVTDVNNLTNTNKLPFIFTVGCNPGQFNDITECFCESWMWATDNNGNPTGAIGHLGSTISQSWEPPMHGQWAMNAILTESYNDNITRSYGGIAVNGCMHMNEAQGSAGINETIYWTLFGDPSLLIRTDIPEELNVSYDNSIIVGQSEFVVEIEEDQSLVALSVDGILKSYSYSNGGVAVLDLSNISNTPGDVDMVVSSFNSYPHQTTLQVITTESAYLVYDSYELVNDSNNLVEYNENVSINITVENVGTYNTNAITVNVSSDDEYISMINSSSVIAYAIVGETATTEILISFSVAGNAPDGHIAQFESILNDGVNEWHITFGIEIHAPVFEILNPTIVDENMDGIWDAGETAIIHVDLVNSGSASFNQYPGAMIYTDNSYVEILSNDVANTFYGIGPNTSYEGSFLVKADVLSPLSTEVNFNISWGYSSTDPCEEEDCVAQGNLSYSTMIGHPSILIWDPSNQHISGSRLVEYFNTNNFSGYDYLNTVNLESIENYNTAFIFLGVYPENHNLQESEAVSFVDLLNSGGNLYMEGADTWAFDTQTSLHGMFGLVGDTDGSADLSTINGLSDTFTEGMSFSYNGGNSYIDRLIPSGGFAILTNDSPLYTTAVAYENPIGDYKTIGASHDLGGLQGDNFDDYVNGILQFFDDGSGGVDPECSPGDINGDGMIDVTDIVRHVNIILDLGAPATDIELCAADVNGDGTINILDLVIVVNIILGPDGRSPERILPISQVDITVYNNSLDLSTEGIIRGIELVIDSKSKELKFNDNLNMNISYNVLDNKHHALIYSLEGNVIKSGEYNLFTSEKSFKVDDIILSNSNNDYVSLNLINEAIPQSFSLKQNYPNPFNPSTLIGVELENSDHIQLVIYDINGRKIKELANGYFNGGVHEFVWNSIDESGSKVSSGLYIYQLITADNVLTKKMLLLK